MTKLWNILKKHFHEDFEWPYYATIIIFLTVNLFINYRYDFENSVIDHYNGKPIRILFYFFFYAWAYYSTVLIVSFFKRKNLFTEKKFVFFSLVGILLLSVNGGFPYILRLLNLMISDYRLLNWAYYTASNVFSFAMLALPLIYVSFYIEKKEREYLGATTSFDLKPYLSILAIIIPFIVVAAFEDGLGTYYPTYKANSVAVIMNWPSWLPAAIYEIAYAVDFFNVEFFFRGFLVIGLSHFIGKEVILPMTVTYCFLHFGKPMGEAISSILGGYILGVIAFYTRSIWGGVILHVGVALTMELAAYLIKN